MELSEMNLAELATRLRDSITRESSLWGNVETAGFEAFADSRLQERQDKKETE